MYVYTYMCIYIYICIYARGPRPDGDCGEPAREARHMCVYIYIYICISLSLSLSLSLYLSIYIYIYIHTHMYTRLYIYIHTYTYTHVCIYIYIYIPRPLQSSPRQPFSQLSQERFPEVWIFTPSKVTHLNLSPSLWVRHCWRNFQGAAAAFARKRSNNLSIRFLEQCLVMRSPNNDEHW